MRPSPRRRNRQSPGFRVLDLSLLSLPHLTTNGLPHFAALSVLMTWQRASLYCLYT